MPFFRVRPYECYFVYFKGTEIMKSSHPAGSVIEIETEEIDKSQAGKLEECEAPEAEEVGGKKEESGGDPFGDENDADKKEPEKDDAKEAAKKLLKSKIG